MKNFKLFYTLVAPILGAILWVGCAKDDPTPLEKFRILQAHNFVDSIAGEALLSDDPVAAFNVLLPQIIGRPGIESASVKDYTLFVKYQHGGLETWSDQPQRFSPPYIERNKPNTSSELNNTNHLEERVEPGIVGNKRVCLINQVYHDEKWLEERKITTDLQKEFTSQGFSVDVYNGNEAGLSFFQDGIQDYGTIFFNTHGVLDDSNVTWIYTGDEITNFLDEILGEYYEFWYTGQIAVGELEENRNGQRTRVKYLKISSKFFKENHEDESFANSLFYLVACHGLENDDLAKALYQKGCQTIVGWDNSNRKGAPVGKEFYRLMLAGKNVGEAFATITPESLIDQYTQGNEQITAKLTYFPQPDGALATLFDTPGNILPIEITSVSNNQIMTNRVVRIAGRIKDALSLSSATLSVNGSAVKLQYDANFYFDQDIDLQSGTNVIKITATGIHTDGNPAFGQTSVNLIGNFPALALWTKLRWNSDATDVDLHLLAAGASTDDLFSENDCYFDNKNTLWNAFLDVDDIDGWGPEHITIPNTPAPGLYTLVVHYWDSHSGVNPSAFISVMTKSESWNSENLNLNLERSYIDFSSGDAYAVCYIEFPSGKIYPIGTKIVTPRNEDWKKIKKTQAPTTHALNR
jgi:uncharacterized protein YfaP (DUF2135 family)